MPVGGSEHEHGAAEDNGRGLARVATQQPGRVGVETNGQLADGHGWCAGRGGVPAGRGWVRWWAAARRGLGWCRRARWCRSRCVGRVRSRRRCRRGWRAVQFPHAFVGGLGLLCAGAPPADRCGVGLGAAAQVRHRVPVVEVEAVACGVPVVVELVEGVAGEVVEGDAALIGSAPLGTAARRSGR